MQEMVKVGIIGGDLYKTMNDKKRIYKNYFK